MNSWQKLDEVIEKIMKEMESKRKVKKDIAFI